VTVLLACMYGISTLIQAAEAAQEPTQARGSLERTHAYDMLKSLLLRLRPSQTCCNQFLLDCWGTYGSESSSLETVRAMCIDG